jgi:hypothetical protein
MEVLSRKKSKSGPMWIYVTLCMVLVVSVGTSCTKPPVQPILVSLSINSEDPDSLLPVYVEPPDQMGRSEGITPLTLLYAKGTAVKVRAPANSVAGEFVAWQIEKTQTLTQATIDLTLFEDVTAVARYGNRPIACIESIESLCGPIPLQVRFGDCSHGVIESRLWEFGDGATSTESSLQHTFSTPGTYRVRLTVRGSSGSDESEVTLTAEPALLSNPVLVESASALSCAGESTWVFDWESMPGAVEYEIKIYENYFNDAPLINCTKVLLIQKRTVSNCTYRVPSNGVCRECGMLSRYYVSLRAARLSCGSVMYGESEAYDITSRVSCSICK